MAAILPAHTIDSSKAESRYFLEYQLAWIGDESAQRLAEKSVRIGWTYADAFKNVRKRLRHARRDYLFSTKDEPTAVEYVETCYRFAELYNLTKSILSRGIEYLKVPRFDELGKDTGFTDDVKVGMIKFDNGSRIIAFSSNPNAMRAFGGDVGLDEFAFHPNPEALWASASGRVTWGFDIGVWSSHNGDGTLFLQFVREAQLGQGGWSYYRVTIEDAVEMGLVEKINQTSGAHLTRAEFIAAARQRARLQEVFDQEYMCQPRGGMNPIVPWSAIQRCEQDYEIERIHLESQKIVQLFGEFHPATAADRVLRIEEYIRSTFAKLFAERLAHLGGFDVAASGQGDLAAIYTDRKLGDVQQLGGLFTCRTEDWHFLQTVLFVFLRSLTAPTFCGDETGLGRQICWTAAQHFPGIFHPINFRGEKHDMGFALMNQLTVAEKQFPKSEPDIGADFFALRKDYQAKRWIFSEGSNPLNQASHCDIAWAGALSTKAGSMQGGPPGDIKAFDRKPHGARATDVRKFSRQEIRHSRRLIG
jgi:phage FluMu gp28-like protein